MKDIVLFFAMTCEGKLASTHMITLAACTLRLGGVFGWGCWSALGPPLPGLWQCVTPAVSWST